MEDPFTPRMRELFKAGRRKSATEEVATRRLQLSEPEFQTLLALIEDRPWSRTWFDECLSAAKSLNR